MLMKRLIIAALYQLAPKTCHRLRLEWGLARKLFEPEIDLVPRLCSSGTAIDVGAGYGEYAYVMSKYAGTVHAFEPNAATCALLRRGLPNSIKVHQVALSDRADSAIMRVPRIASTLGTIEATNPLTIAGSVDVADVRTERLDDYDFDDVTFIKIDVEGHELAVLGGAGRTIERNRPALQIEVENRHAPGALERTVASLASYGYQCLFLDDGSLRPIEDFVPEVDQDITNLTNDGRNKSGRYINNFMFFQREKLKTFGDILAQR